MRRTPRRRPGCCPTTTSYGTPPGSASTRCPDRSQIGGIGADDPQPDAEVGLRRARAATTVMLALPGSAYLYQGEELGLPEATDLPDDVRAGPHVGAVGSHLTAVVTAVGSRCRGRATLRRTASGRRTARGCRSPPSFGELAVDRQTGVAGSTLELYRTLLRLRRAHRTGRGSLTWLDLGENVLAFDISSDGGAPVRVIANLGAEVLPLPEGEVLVASGEFDAAEGSADRLRGVVADLRRLRISSPGPAQRRLPRVFCCSVFWATICSTSRFQSCSRINR